MNETHAEQQELTRLLDEIYRHYGYDYREYARASLTRRVQKQLSIEQLDTIPELRRKIVADKECMERFILTMSINVTSMFRDPSFYTALRNDVVPRLRTYPFVRIWSAGCSSGEELLSLAIVLDEEGLLDRARIYATDINETVLAKARTGIVPLGAMKEYTRDYTKAGGKRAFSEYYTAKYDNVIFRQSLTKNVVFAQHNLAVDGPFNEFNLIICRNVLIYFNRDLQDRVIALFRDSLCRFGLLGLGSKESLRFSRHTADFETLDGENRIFRRVE